MIHSESQTASCQRLSNKALPRDAAITAHVDAATKVAVEGLAKEDGRTVSQYIERLLISHLKEKGKLPRKSKA